MSWRPMLQNQNIINPKQHLQMSVRLLLKRTPKKRRQRRWRMVWRWICSAIWLKYSWIDAYIIGKTIKTILNLSVVSSCRRCLPLRITQKPLPEGFLHFTGMHSLQRAHSDQSLYHVLWFIRYIFVDVLELSFLDLFEKIVLALGPKRVVSLQNHKKKYT